MKLYDFLQVTNQGFDCVDNTFDYTIYIEIAPSTKESDKDAYDKFIDFVAKNVEVITTGKNTIANTPILFVNFYKFIEKYQNIFNAFAYNNCAIYPGKSDDKDDAVYKSLLILDDMARGNYSDKQYIEFLELVRDTKNV